MTVYHAPVLVERILELARHARRVVDATVGGGGHAAALAGAGAEVLAFDRDPDAVGQVAQRLPEMDCHLGRFADPAVIGAAREFAPDFVLLDLGVSSHQLDHDARGFSFRPGTALDMRMDPAVSTAADLLNNAPVAELVNVFADYGDERRARRLAGTIVRRRQGHPFAMSDDLVNAIREVKGPRAGPAVFARLFQAVRIAVNSELEQLTAALPAYRDALVPGGTLAVISYHSGEDRLVKQAFRDWGRPCVCPSEQPVCTCRGRPLGEVHTRRPIRPEDDEVQRNPRARSARLRAFRIDESA